MGGGDLVTRSSEDRLLELPLLLRPENVLLANDVTDDGSETTEELASVMLLPMLLLLEASLLSSDMTDSEESVVSLESTVSTDEAELLA